jgi:hypothetical protein
LGAKSDIVFVSPAAIGADFHFDAFGNANASHRASTNAGLRGHGFSIKYGTTPWA